MMKQMTVMGLAAAAVLTGLATALFTGCESDSGDTLIRGVDIYVGGYYANATEGEPIVTRNSGGTITSLDLIQTGDRLQAVDSEGAVYNGSLGQVSGGDPARATFTLEGTSKANVDVTINGTIEVSDGGIMRGQWIEPALIGSVYAESMSPFVPTNAPPPTTNTNTTVSVSREDAARGTALTLRSSAWPDRV